MDTRQGDKQMINNITIVGGGSAGWMTAATLVKAFPEKQISVIESKDFPIVGVGESTLGGIRTWTRFIGLDEADFFPATDASLKMSIKFTDFYKKNSGGFHYPFGQPFAPYDENPFDVWHKKKHYYPETPTSDLTACLFPASSLWENNKYSTNANGEFDNFVPDRDVAYHFDATKFGQWLKNNYCIPRGVTLIVDSVKKVFVNESGVEKLLMESGSELTADLFIDCTGWKSLLLGDALQEPFESYADMLPNNRAWATQVPYKNIEKELEPYTNCTAIGNGWVWNIPLWSRIGTGYVYSDKFIDPEDAKKEFKKHLKTKMVVERTEEEIENFQFKDVQMRIGIHNKTFVKNVVAIGLSAGFIEPLESNGLFSVHEFLHKLLAVLKRNDISQFDRDMYNVSCRNLFHGFSKFVALHYALSHRDDTPYWKAIKNKSFVDQHGDPYSLTRVDNFYELGNSFMNVWFYPPNIGGIPYIATGERLFMWDDYRDSTSSLIHQYNPLESIKPILESWEVRKNQWAKEASKMPTLYEHLKKTYYTKDKL
jgi:hypothetical protein